MVFARDTVPAGQAASELGPKQVVWASLLLFLLVFAAFAPSLRNNFVNFDDPDYVLWNPHVRSGLTTGNVSWAFSSAYAGNWHPLTWLSHMVDCEVYGLRAWGHHLSSTLLHAANSVLAFLFFRRTTGAFWRSLCVAALFGLHPLRVESVAWVAERKDVLSTFFFLLTLTAYAQYARFQIPEPGVGPTDRAQNFLSSCPRAWVWYASTFVLFGLGLMSKPMLVSLPFLLLLLDYWPLQRLKSWGLRSGHRGLWALFLEKAPFLLIAVAVGTATVVAQQSGGAVAAMGRIPWHSTVGNVAISYARYIGKLLYPANLAVYYPYSRSWPVIEVLAAGAALFAASALVIVLRRERPYLPVGWFWFVGTLIPVIGLVQIGGQSIADRYTYIPSLGFLICLVWGVFDVTARCRRQSIILAALFGTAVVCCSGLTLRQIGWWKDGETLFRHALTVTGGNYMAHLNLGSALQQKGKSPDEAMAHFREALKLRPNSFAARMNLAIMLDQAGKLDEAARQYRQALRLSPGEVELRFNLGVVLYKLRRFTEALQQFKLVLTRKPNYSEAHQNLGAIFYLQGHLDEAISEYEEALRLKPSNAAAKDALDHLRPLKTPGRRMDL